MTFKKEKNDFLRKKDKSRKGSIDIKIKKLVDRINSLEGFYTTSSCSGRMLLLAIPRSNKKNEVQYLFCSHKKIKYWDIKKINDLLPHPKGWGFLCRGVMLLLIFNVRCHRCNVIVANSYCTSSSTPKVALRIS